MIKGKPLPDIVASVNGAPLSAQLLEREMTAFKLIASQQGHNIPDADEEEILRGVLMKAIDQELLRQKGKEMNISISREKIQTEIEHIKSQFPSEELFMHALGVQRLTLDTLEQKIDRQLTNEEYIREVIVPKVKLDDAAPLKFYNENTASFMEPEQYRVSHIFTATVEAPKDAYDSPEDAGKAKRMIARVNSEAKKTIETVQKKLKAGGNFEELAKTYSEDEASRSKGGDLGNLPLDQVQPEIAMAISKLKPNEVSSPVLSPSGYHIFKLTEKIPSRPVPFKEVESTILNHLLKMETQKQIEDNLAEWRKSADIKIFL